MKNSALGVPGSLHVCLIIKELGSARLGEDAGAGLDETVVLAQAPDESPDQLTVRAAERLAWSEEHAAGFDAAHYQLGPAAGRDWSRARFRLLLALLANARAHGRLRLIVIEAPACAASQRQELLNVVECLWSLPPDRRPELRFVFGAPLPVVEVRLAHAN
jgi:hypothetical protein